MNDVEELLKLRAEDYEKNFFSLRDVEWNVAIQLYAGYIALGAAFAKVSEFPISPSVRFVFLGVLTVLLVGWYLSRRIQERMHLTRNMQNAYYDELHKRLKFDRPPDRGKVIHSRWYAFGAQQALSVMLAAGLSLFVFLVPAGAIVSCP